MINLPVGSVVKRSRQPDINCHTAGYSQEKIYISDIYKTSAKTGKKFLTACPFSSATLWHMYNFLNEHCYDPARTQERTQDYMRDKTDGYHNKEYPLS